MKRIIVFSIALLLLLGCGGKKAAAPQVQLDARAEQTAAPAAEPAPTETPAPTDEPMPADQPGATDVPPEIVAEPAPEAGFADQLVAAWAAAGLLEGLYPFENEDAFDYYGVDLSAGKGGAAFGDAVGYTNEALVLEADGAYLDEAEVLLQNHLEDVKDQFRSYDAAALALAEKAVLLREGDVLLFLLSPNADAMLAVYRGLTA